jgi:hypothetical protein
MRFTSKKLPRSVLKQVYSALFHCGINEITLVSRGDTRVDHHMLLHSPLAKSKEWN